VEDLRKENALLKEQLDMSATLNLRLMARNEELSQKVEELARKVEELARELSKNSSNSHKPPSSDGLGSGRSHRRKKRRSGRKRGGQPGHKGHHRALLPPEQVNQIKDLFPKFCEFCQQVPPQTPDPDPIVHQVVDLLENGSRYVVEYRRHQVRCTCGAWVTASEEGVPTSSFGPHLASTVCMLTGVYHMSRRQVVQILKELFGISISLGSVSNLEGRMTTALASASEEALAHVEKSKLKNVDETSWIRDAARCSAWVFACMTATVFRIAPDGRRSTLRKLLRRSRGVLVSDRATVFLYWSMGRRQICWSHLLRSYVGFSQRAGPAGALGQELVEYSEQVLHYWRCYQSGKLSRARFVQWTTAVRKAMKPCLERAARAGIPEVSGSCENMLEHWSAMWTFVNVPGVEPTNNHAERELRRLVLWRKRCFGTQSERGDRYVERIMTVAHTMRKQGGQVLDFLCQSLVAMQQERSAPSLLAAA